LSEFEQVKIIAVDLNKIESLSEKVIPYICDVSKPTEIDRLFEFALSHFSTIDIFIANAGFAYYEEINQPDWQRIEKIFQVENESLKRWS
jgi:uncharacterized protein